MEYFMAVFQSISTVGASITGDNYEKHRLHGVDIAYFTVIGGMWSAI